MKKYIQCGYEHKCKKKDCLNCSRRKRYGLSLTLAEEIVIENFAVCDLEDMIKYKKEELDLMQDIMRKTMKKIFKEDRNEKS
jgi:hypothetical protein